MIYYELTEIYLYYFTKNINNIKDLQIKHKVIKLIEF